MQPLDTSTLGAIRVDTNANTVKAQVVRDAILAIADTTTNHRVLTAAMQLVAQMSDEEARKLGRLLR